MQIKTFYQNQALKRRKRKINGEIRFLDYSKLSRNSSFVKKHFPFRPF